MLGKKRTKGRTAADFAQELQDIMDDSEGGAHNYPRIKKAINVELRAAAGDEKHERRERLDARMEPRTAEGGSAQPEVSRTESE